MNNFLGSFNDFRWVVTESEFRKALRRGHAGDLIPTGDPRRYQFDPIRLDSPATISATALHVRNPDVQLGEPVSVSWDAHFLSGLRRSQIVETFDGAVEVHALLPLIRPFFHVRFSSPLRAEMFEREMSIPLDLDLLAHLNPIEIDPALADLRRNHGRREANLTPPLPIGGPSIDIRSADIDLRTLDRLMGAAELLVGSECGATQVELMCAVMSPEPRPNTTTLSSDLHAVRWGIPNSSSLLSSVCEFILQLPTRMSPRPFAIEEQSDLILYVRSAVSDVQPHRSFLDEFLHLVRTGQGLNHLLTKTDNLVLQSLVIFMSNNRDPREVAGLKATHFGVDGAALALCAFFTGLRYPRELIPRDLTWHALRTVDIQDFVSLVNGNIELTGPANRLVEVEDHILKLNGEVFSPPSQFDVLELSNTSSRVRIRSQKEVIAHSRVVRIVVEDRSKVTRCKKIEIPQVRPHVEKEFIREIYLQQSKARKPHLASWKLNVFSNRDIDQLIESKSYVELKISGTFFIELEDKKRIEYRNASIELPVESISSDTLTTNKKLSPAKVKNLIVGLMITRTIR